MALRDNTIQPTKHQLQRMRRSLTDRRYKNLVGFLYDSSGERIDHIMPYFVNLYPDWQTRYATGPGNQWFGVTREEIEGPPILTSRTSWR